jgi:hypothetical protein
MANKRVTRGTENIPSEATSKGGMNESTPAQQRERADERLQRAHKELDSGPKIGEMGEYLPAAYLKTRTVVENKVAKKITLTVIDR